MHRSKQHYHWIPSAVRDPWFAQRETASRRFLRNPIRCFDQAAAISPCASVDGSSLHGSTLSQCPNAVSDPRAHETDKVWKSSVSCQREQDGLKSCSSSRPGGKCGAPVWRLGLLFQTRVINVLHPLFDCPRRRQMDRSMRDG